ncbi:hypothetical protein UlMin_004830 [Ulmus minor]
MDPLDNYFFCIAYHKITFTQFLPNQNNSAMEETLLYIFLTLIFILIASKLFFKTRRRHNSNLPPSPPSLPIIGHLHLLKSSAYETFRSLSKKYGSVFSLRFGSRLVVVVSSPSAVEECFTKNDFVFANRPPLLMGKHLGFNYTILTQAPYGDHWRNLRRIGASEIFSTNRQNMFSGIRSDEIKRSLCKLSQNSLDDFGKVELKSMFWDLTFNIIMRMVAGKRFSGDEAHQFKKLMNEMFSVSGVANPNEFLPFFNWFSRGYEKKVRRVAEKTDVFLQGLINKHRSEKQWNNDTVIDHLLSLQESQPEYYTDQIIKGFVMVIVVAGSETSAYSMEWAMANLLNHPHILKKASDELDAQVGKQHHLVDESDVSKLHYLQNIILESSRLYPVTPLLSPHFSSDDCTIAGFDVPRGTILLVNSWAIHRDPKWWDDEESFKPERFEDGKGTAYKLMPFGLGRRACPGQYMAQSVIGLTLASLIQCFEWKRVGEEKVDMTEGKGSFMPKVVPLEAMCRARPIMNSILSEYAN